MKILTTFSGKFGDILWSLPTVRALSRKLWDGVWMRSGQPLDECHFACMPQYESLLPLLNAQAYIDKAFVIKEWKCLGSPFGDQPWQPPAPYDVGTFRADTIPGVIDGTYNEVYHLTYRQHPGYGPNATPLVEFIAQQQGIKLDGTVLALAPFIEVNQEEWIETSAPFVAYAFNPSYADQKAAFLTEVVKVIQHRPDYPRDGLVFVNVAEYPWKKAALWIRNARCFIGCRSANYVIAHGVGQRVICFEPEPWRRYRTYSYPFGEEFLLLFRGSEPEAAVEQTINQLRKWEVI